MKTHKKLKAGITGATGFIGGRLAERLTGDGFSIRCLVRETSDTEKLRSLGAELVRGDLCDSESLQTFPQGCDYVFHLASKVSDWGPRDDFFRQNVEATKTLLQSCIEAGVKRFIYMSSSGVLWNASLFGTVNLDNVDENYPCPQNYNNFYSETKALSEKLVREYDGLEGLETVILRPSNVWGAGDTVILPRVADACLKGILVNMGFNKKIVSPCHVLNLVHATVLAASAPSAPGNTYFVNDGLQIDTGRFVSDQLTSIGIEWKKPITIPYALGYCVAFALEKIFELRRSETPPVLTRFGVCALSKSRTYSIQRARRDLGYEPVCSYEAGMRGLAEWVSEIGGYEKILGK